MSYANFKPTVWSKYIQHELPKFTVFKQDCDFKFEEEAGQGKCKTSRGSSGTPRY